MSDRFCEELEHFLDHVDNFLDGRTTLNIDYWYIRLNNALNDEYRLRSGQLPIQGAYLHDQGGRPPGSKDLRIRKSRNHLPSIKKRPKA